MSEITKLLAKKDGLLIQIACLVDDLNEYINHPVETVSVEQLHYQYDFIVNELAIIDRKLAFEFSKQRIRLIMKNIDLKEFTDKATSSIVFTVKDLPRHHFSMFETPNPANQ